MIQCTWGNTLCDTRIRHIEGDTSYAGIKLRDTVIIHVSRKSRVIHLCFTIISWCYMVNTCIPTKASQYVCRKHDTLLIHRKYDVLLFTVVSQSIDMCDTCAIHRCPTVSWYEILSAYHEVSQSITYVLYNVSRPSSRPPIRRHPPWVVLGGLVVVDRQDGVLIRIVHVSRVYHDVSRPITTTPVVSILIHVSIYSQ